MDFELHVFLLGLFSFVNDYAYWFQGSDDLKILCSDNFLKVPNYGKKNAGLAIV